MPASYDTEYFVEGLEMPEYLVPRVLNLPQLLLGERPEDFYVLFEAMLCELIPDLDLEWLLAIDLAWLLFEIERYRRWKNAIVVMSKRPALEEALMRSDPQYSLLEEPGRMVRSQVRMKVDSLGGDFKKDRDVAAQLQHYGYDDDALNAAAFRHSVPSLVAIERFEASARHQFTTALKEAAVRREFKLRAEQLRKRMLAEQRQLEAKPPANSEQRSEPT
jgi:hypothetical protein